MPYHPLFVDLDFGPKVAVDAELVGAIVGALVEAATVYFNVEVAEAFVARSSVSWNMHVHFPSIYVDRETGKGYREVVLQMLCDRHGGGGVDWKKVYDMHDT